MNTLDDQVILPEFDYTMLNEGSWEIGFLSFDEMFAFIYYVMKRKSNTAWVGIAVKLMYRWGDRENEDLFLSHCDPLLGFLT